MHCYFLDRGNMTVDVGMVAVVVGGEEGAAVAVHRKDLAVEEDSAAAYDSYYTLVDTNQVGHLHRALEHLSWP